MKNIIFDIGNVFVRWSPLENLEACFPEQKPTIIWGTIHSDWLDLNRGKMTLEEAVDIFHKKTKLPADGFRGFCDKIMTQATFLPDTITLQDELKESGYSLYYLSDNVHEFAAYYRDACPFMQKFDGGVISAEIGCLKPGPQIYLHLLDKYKLDPAACIFFDDVPANVEGAESVGMKAFVFTDAEACRRDLVTSGVAMRPRLQELHV